MEIINVALVEDNHLRELTHFPVNPETRETDIRKAEDYFIKVIKDITGNDFSDDEINDILADGYYDGETDGTYDGSYISHNYSVSLMWTFQDICE